MSTPNQDQTTTNFEDSKLIDELGPGDVCRSHESLVEIGMKKFNELYPEYKKSYRELLLKEVRVTTSSRLPRRIRQELVGHLKKDILPFLRDRLHSLYDLLEIVGPTPDDASFKFQPSLKLVLEIDELAIQMISSITSICDQLVFEPCSFPDFLPASADQNTTRSESEALEEISYLPWKLLISEIDDILDDFAVIFLTGEIHRRSLEGETLTEWFRKVKALARYITMYELKVIGRPDRQNYTIEFRNQLCDVGTHMNEMISILTKHDQQYIYRSRKARILARVLYEPKVPLLKAAILFIKLSRLFLSKIYKYTKRDCSFLQRMTMAQLEASIRQIPDVDGNDLTIQNHFQIIIEEVDSCPAARSSWSTESAMESVRGVQAIFANLLIIVLQSLDNPTCSDSDQPSVENTGIWYTTWARAYLSAVETFHRHFREI